MRLTLDWDSEEARQDNYERSKRAADGAWELRQSSGGDGYHFVAHDVFSNTESAIDRMFNLRETFGDDPKRVSLDRKRWNLGSPFVQVLYRRKYMERYQRPDEDTGYDTGNEVQVLESSDETVTTEDRRIKDPDSGRLDYNLITELLIESAYDSIRETAESLGVSARSVRRWRDRDAEPNAENRETLKRRARYYGIGHYVQGSEGNGRAAESVRYVDVDHQRRTIVEYLDVPYGPPSEIDNDDREYKLLQVETGTFNANHGMEPHREAHEKAVDKLLDILSPTANGTSLDLDRDLARDKGWKSDNNPAIRNPDSVHYEEEVLDEGESRLYTDNLPSKGRINGAPDSHIITEILLWDEDMTSVEWHVILVDDADNWRNHTVLRDTKGWW